MRRWVVELGIARREVGFVFNNCTLDLCPACSAAYHHYISPSARPDDWGSFYPPWLAETAHDSGTDASSVGSLHTRDSEVFGTVVVVDPLASSLAVETCGPDKLASARYTWSWGYAQDCSHSGSAHYP